MNKRIAVFVMTVAITALLNRVWKVSPGAKDSIYIFLPNGTLLMTSCVETYRVARWTKDPKRSDTVRLTEDGQPSATLTLDKADSTTARITETLVRSGEKKTLTFTALDKEFVCPDLPK